MLYVTDMEQEYSTIKKGSGVLYMCANLLYHRVRTNGNVKYLKCNVSGCDGSAKLVGDRFFLGVSNVIYGFFKHASLNITRLDGIQ